MASRIDNVILHEDSQGKVTPSWLVEGNTRYAINTVVRLDYKEIRPALASDISGFCAGLFLIVASVAYPAYRAEFPAFLSNSFWIVGILMTLGASIHLYRASPRYKVGVMLLDGSFLKLTRSSKAEALALLEALTSAMDWHRNGEFLIDANRASHLKKRIAKGGGGWASPAAASNDPNVAETGQGQRPSNGATENKRQSMRRLMPLLSSLFRDHDTD